MGIEEPDDATIIVSAKDLADANIDDATIIVSNPAALLAEFDQSPLDDATIIVSNSSKLLDELTDAPVDDATIIVSNPASLLAELEQNDVSDATIVVSRTSPTIEEATILTSSRAEPELEEATTTNGRSVVAETSQPLPVPELQTRMTDAPLPSVSSVQEAEAVFDPSKVDAESLVQRISEVVVPDHGGVTLSTEEIVPPVVTRTGTSRANLMSKNKRRRSMSSMGVIIAVTIAVILVGGTLAVIVASVL